MSSVSIVLTPASRRSPSPRLELLAWIGLLASLLAVFAAATGPDRCIVGYAAMSPQDFTAWVTAICSAVGLVAATANSVAIVIHRWGKRPQKQRKARHATNDSTAAADPG